MVTEFINDDIITEAYNTIQNMFIDYDNYRNKIDHSESYAEKLHERFIVLNNFYNAAIQTIRILEGKRNITFIQNNYDKDITHSEITSAKIQLKQANEQLAKMKEIIYFNGWNEKIIAGISTKEYNEIKRANSIARCKEIWSDLF